MDVATPASIFQLLPLFRHRKVTIYWNMVQPSPIWLSGTRIPDLLEDLGAIFGPNVEVRILPPHLSVERGKATGDFGVEVRWQGEAIAFVVEAKTRSTPRMLEEAVRQAQRSARTTGLAPMVVVPYLPEERLDWLAREGVSGLDLCGNGIVVVPDRLLLRSSGRANRYPDSQPARFAYRGNTSLVPRIFFRRPVFASVKEVQAEVAAAGVEVALSTVSKALARMTEDLVIERKPGRIALLQPDKLLDLLAKSFTLPQPDCMIRAKLLAPLPELFARVKTNQEIQMVLSGASSQQYYAAGLRSDIPVLLTLDWRLLFEQAGDLFQATERFADVELLEVRDPTAFLDARRDPSGIVYASPVQAYLELDNSGDKRDKELSQQIREVILHSLRV